MGWFTPYWKKAVTPDTAKKLAGESAVKLAEIAREAPVEDVAAYAVVLLGRKNNKHTGKLLQEISDAQVPARVKAAAKLQLTIRQGVDYNSRDTVKSNIWFEMRNGGLLPHDVLVSIPNAADWMFRVLMLGAVLRDVEEPDRETKAWLHRMLDDMTVIDEAGIALSCLLSSLPDRLDGEISAEESRRLRKIYDGNEAAKKRLVLYFIYDDRSFLKAPRAYIPDPYHTLVRVWARHEDDPVLRQLAAIEPILNRYAYDVDVRSPEADRIDAETQTTLDSLGIRAEDIPDEVLLKALEFHMNFHAGAAPAQIGMKTGRRKIARFLL